jgi:hypothetical protein
MKPIAWYDPTNGMVSTDNDCPLFTPLGQIWGLYPKEEWVGLTDEEITQIIEMGLGIRDSIETAEAKLKEKNT